MRNDMLKVITERPRSKGVWERTGMSSRLEQDQENLPSFVGMGNTPYHRRSKSFSDLIGPLRRFILKSCGRPWADVHSEIAGTIKGRNTIQQHLMDHVRQYIEEKVVIDPDGTIWDSARKYRLDDWFTIAYVHPSTGILMRAPKRKQERYGSDDKKWNEENTRVLSDTERLIRVAGIWYRFKLAHEKDLPVWSYTDSTGYTHVHRIYPKNAGQKARGVPEKYYVRSKEQLSSKELKENNLTNAH